MPTKFQIAVWRACAKIPKGRVSTYAEIAKAIGKSGAARAVGNALNQNPHAPHVPCHRVVKSDGNVGGFVHGSKKKIELLRKDGIEIEKGQIIGFKKILILRKK